MRALESLDRAATVPLWWESSSAAPRPTLAGDRSVDVCVVGAGFSGLWTAYYLARHRPELRVLVVERDHVGFGASGRNGGWVVGELAGSFDDYAARGGHQAALRQTRDVFDAVDEVGRVVRRERIDADFLKGGNVRLARTTPQRRRQVDELAEWRRLGFGAEILRDLDPSEARARCGATRIRGGLFFAPCAVVDPGRLVAGLAGAVERAGVEIVERTTARSVEPGRVSTDRGTIRAEVVVAAVEAYGRDLPGGRRRLLPTYSQMIATEPLPETAWERIGLADRPTFADDRQVVVYGQRTADDRLAFGSQHVSYRFGSRIDPETENHRPTHRVVVRRLVDLFPELADTTITHRWGGVLGIPRDWVPGLAYDRRRGFGRLGGYVGEGVAAANLAGRTLADLVLERETDRTRHPWVGVEHPRWEPEPLRWTGVMGSRRLLALADAREAATDRPATAVLGLARRLREL